MKRRPMSSLLLLAALFAVTTAQCPWQREMPELLSSCLCSYNLGHELSVQCDIVDFSKLLGALNRFATSTPLDLLYINNSTINEIGDEAFMKLKVHSMQLSGCKIRKISDGAFAGQEQSLRNLNLQDNELTVVPVNSLRNLRSLSLLDLSHNKISTVPMNAFESLVKLATLKLSDNNVTLDDGALKGLEGSLKNLNLKGTKQKEVPKAIQGMRTLAFLDLSQNMIKELPGPSGDQTFEGLFALTALNLERNLIQNLHENAFFGVKRTLSSLSLLNNLLPDFPTTAISSLRELRVLDIGFNLLTELPENSFKGNPSITLLALDGNPLATIPFEALSHLNSTLRGLSLGGRFLHCDCRLAWVINWIRHDLQVTSRERNPQFCGSPPRFRDRSFYSIQPEELSCSARDKTSTTTSTKPTIQKKKDSEEEKPKEPVGVATVISADLDDLIQANPELLPSTSSTTKQPFTKSTPVQSSTSITTKVTTVSSTTTKSTTSSKLKASIPWKNTQKPPMVLAYPTRGKADESKEVIVKNAFRQDSSVIIQWGSETANILGFRVVYRLFGDKSFKQGPPLEASEREFKIKNVPSQECIIVCVVSLEEINVTPDTVPYSQCREVRTVSSASSNMDKITIAASAAICGTIVVAVIVFIAASRRRSRKLHEIHQQKMGMKHGIPIAGLPVNCCTGLPNSPGEPLSSLATLSAFNATKFFHLRAIYEITPDVYVRQGTNSIYKIIVEFCLPNDREVGFLLRVLHPARRTIICRTQQYLPAENGYHFNMFYWINGLLKEWDQVSAYSTHSQRPRMYTCDAPPSIDDMRSHFGPKGPKRSNADGQSQNSFSNHSGRYLTASAFPNNLLASRQDLRQSRQSLAMQSDRMSARPHHVAPAHSIVSSSRRSRPRSRSREHQRPSSRYSNAGSTHTLNNYCDNSDNWTDHDMDIYMARNPTTRNGLVPL